MKDTLNRENFLCTAAYLVFEHLPYQSQYKSLFVTDLMACASYEAVAELIIYFYDYDLMFIDIFGEDRYNAFCALYEEKGSVAAGDLEAPDAFDVD